MFIYEANKAYGVSKESSNKRATKFIEAVSKDIEEASNAGVTRIKEHEVQGSVILGLVDFLVEAGYQVDYEEDGDLNTGVVSYPTYSLTIDWSNIIDDGED